MALPKSLTQPLRQGQLTIGSGYRAYFAPFNQQAAVSQSSTSIGPKIYDLEVINKFIDNPPGSPPTTGWFDLGLVDKFKISPASKIGNVITGYRGAVRAKYRGEVAEKCSFVFREMSRTALSIATGCQIFNLLTSTASASTVGPLSSSGVTAIPIGASGYVASGAVANYVGQPTLYVAAGSGASFSVNDLIVCDQDYNNTSFGYVGDSGANVFQGAVSDVDFIRKTSDYVQNVIAIVGDALILAGPFVGGGNSVFGVTPNTGPTAGAKVQKIKGYASRNGGTFIKEWSAIFINDTIDASQILMYYPRIAPDVFTGVDEAAIANISSMKEFQLNASYEAMAYDDPLDGETVVSYMGYYPHPGTNPSI